MMLTRRSLAVGSTALAATSLALGPALTSEALAAPDRRRHRPPRSTEGGQAVLAWERIAFRTVYADLTPVIGSTPPPVPTATPIPVGVPVLGFTALAMYRGAQWSAHLGNSSESAAVARAAHDVLAHYFPGSLAQLDADLATSMGAIGPGPSLTKGSRVGAEAARQVIESREGDGWYDPRIHYSKAPGAGVWQPSAPNTDMLAPWLGSLRPLVVAAEPQRGPYPLTSAAWAQDYEEVRALGSLGSTERTPAQTATALFYNSSNSGMAVADAVVRYLDWHPLGILETARLFARMHAAAADSIIVCWQQKRDVGFWRPFQAISGQFDDGNAGTTAEPGWTPLVAMPNYSDYHSGHGSLTGSQVEVVRRTLGENIGLEIRSSTSSRTYTTLSEIEGEAFPARIWGGLHYRKAMTDAYENAHLTAVRVIGSLD
jgi:hypothetical protein